MQDVQVQPQSIGQLAEVLAPERAAAFVQAAGRARELLRGRVVWNVNSTASGGGVAEMLQTLLAYALGAGVDTRWLVIAGDPAFYAITKRLHNALHGAGDPMPFSDTDREHYTRVTEKNAAELRDRVGPRDIVLLHDPQTAGLVPGVRAVGVPVLWRCHIGADVENEQTAAGWAFLRPFVAQADAFVFSRKAYAPGWIEPARLAVIPPSIDPFSTKNRPLTTDVVARVLVRAGLVDGPDVDGPVTFPCRNGTIRTLRTHTGVLSDGPPPPPDARLVVQVSRWDRLKDMAGVMAGFVAGLPDVDDVRLVLAGPAVTGVSDDPEGAEVFAECQAAWRRLPERQRRKVHLASIPMDDVDENAVIVNALQRHATVVTQKSLAEGFGLTVTEAMWKARPVVASAVGGIRDQIADGADGLLLGDPHDLAGFGAAVRRLIDDPGYAGRLGEAARERARDQFLGDRHLGQYETLLAGLLS
jgi:trehalose synthase